MQAAIRSAILLASGPIRPIDIEDGASARIPPKYKPVQGPESPELIGAPVDRGETGGEIRDPRDDRAVDRSNPTEKMDTIAREVTQAESPPVTAASRGLRRSG